jgi:hypothetical protein
VLFPSVEFVRCTAVFELVGVVVEVCMVESHVLAHLSYGTACSEVTVSEADRSSPL